jgi:hypothetical protein
MKENNREPLDGCSAKFNPRPTRAKPNGLNIKNISNIQAIKLIFLINFIKRKILSYSNKKILRMNH